MPRGATQSDVQPFSVPTQGWDAGVNIRDAWNKLLPNEARIIENCILDEKGGANKRLGTNNAGAFGVGADRGISIYTFNRATSAPQVLLHTTAGKLYWTADPTANPAVWTQIATGLSTTVPLSFETFAGNCYMSNGVDAYAKWDGAAYTTFPTAPKGKYLRLWKDTMFLSGVTGLPDRIYESAPGDAETWPVASWIDIAKGDGDQVKALGSDGYTLVVFKQKRHMSITDPVTLANRVVDSEKGCESHFSVIQFESYIYFLSRRGICRYLGDAPAEIISYKLDPLFQPDVLNLNALETAWAYSIDNRVCWALPEVGNNYPTLQIDYYPRLGPITPYGYRMIGPWSFSRLPAQCFTRWRYAGNDILYGAAMAANKLYWLYAPIGTDDGAVFTAIVETGAYDFGAPTRTKYIRRVRVLGRGKVIMQLRRNFQTAVYLTDIVDMTGTVDTWNLADSWGVGTWGPDSIIKEITVNTDAYGRAFSLRFTDSETTFGRKLLEVGSREYALNAGEWGIYMAVIDGDVLGLRQ